MRPSQITFPIRPFAGQKRHGHTLVELTVCLAVSTLLIGGIGSVFFVTSRGAALSGPTADTIEASEVLHELADEIRYAIFVTDRSASMIQFAVADRDGDEQPDVIRYEWSGTPGDPLTRSFNHGSAQTVAEDVYEFELSYATRQTTEEVLGPDVESSEVVLIEHTASSSPAEADVTTANWLAQYFHPDDFDLPPYTTSWKITKVEFVAKQGDPAGEIWVQIRPATGDNKPTSTVLEQVIVKGSLDLSLSFAWEPVTFANVSGLSPNQGHCLVLEWLKKEPAVWIQHETAVGSGGRLRTTNSGATWDDHSPESMFYKIYGTYMSPGPPIPITREYLTGVDASMQIGDSGYSRIDTGVNLLNTPELLSAFWKLDFDEDPRTVDSNFDGQGDWSDQYAASFDPANLIGGIWYSPNESGSNRHVLETEPDNGFVNPITANVRYKCTSVGGWSTTFWINADRAVNMYAPLVFKLYKPNASTHELGVGEWHHASGYRWDKYYTVANDEFIGMRVVIDPASNTYSVFINNVFMDSFAYVRSTNYSGDVARIYSDECTGEFDSFSLRVSE